MKIHRISEVAMAWILALVLGAMVNIVHGA